MSAISRRDFLAGMTIAGTVALTRGFALGGQSARRIKSGTDLVELGRCGLRTTVLGVGTGTQSGNQQRALGQDGFTKLVRHALDRGIRYIDTADSYTMHVLVRFALEGVPREQYFIQTKTGARHPEVAKADINRFCRELKVDYIDSLLMHCMTRKGWQADMRPVMDVLREAKRKGRIRAIGVSCHGWDPLVSSVDAEDIDIHLVRINPFGAHMDGPPEAVAAQIKRMHDKGRGVIGMKVFGETGFDGRQKRLQALKYVLGLGCVDAFTIGFTSTAQIDETLELIRQALA